MDDYLDIILYTSIGIVTLIFIYFVRVFSTKGIHYWITYWRAVFVLQSYHKTYPRKLPTYERLKEKNLSPFEVGIIPFPSEYESENPSSSKFFQNQDGIHFFGVDSDQNSLDVYINKIQEDMASVWILLKLSCDEVYRLPFSFDTRVPYLSNETLFHSSGLQIRCLSPLRKWRISYNGLLQKCHLKDGAGKKRELIHVKFSFLWLSMSVYQELNIDFNSKELASAFAEASRYISFDDLKCFHNLQNRYEQWGQLMGTLNISGKEEKELYLWTCRTRTFDSLLCNDESVIHSAKFYMYFKEGYPLKIEAISVKNFLSNYISGYSVTGLGGITEISDCDFNFTMLQQQSHKLTLTLKLCRKKKSITIEFIGGDDVFYTGADLKRCLTMKPFNVRSDNGDSGFGVLHINTRSKHDLDYAFTPPLLLLKDEKYSTTDKVISLLTDDNCKSSLISGGKGCSLALLTSLSKTQPLFEVPRGFVITTTAFENHIKNNGIIALAIQRLVEVSGGKINSDLKTECAKCMEEFQSVKLSDNLKQEIENTLLDMYTSIENIRFSVRSSACGEDSEDLSAAGQMLTVLGVRGINNILDAVVKCWSSKFGFEAVQYARQNGQSIKLSMAVVIQEMVPSDVAGVMFTVDPVTGDPSYPYITANYGLGETVVSSIVEPDTFILKRKEDNSVIIHEKIIGAKKTQIHMKDGNGTEQKTLDCESLRTCLSDEWALKIGSIGILIETCFCGARDIEWALHNNKLFLLQARPVTTLHTETDFELIHDQDTPIRSDAEYWTRANTGEVFLGATSPLGISLVVGCMDIFSHKGNIVRERMSSRHFCPYIFHVLPVTYKQVTLSVIDTLYRNNRKEVSSQQRGFEIGIFGRVIGTEEMHQAGIRKYGYISKYKNWMMMGFLFLFSFKAPKMIEHYQEKLNKFKLPLQSYTNYIETWNGLIKLMEEFSEEVSLTHGFVTFLSSFYNLIVINSLSRGKEIWEPELYCDFASVLSACSNVESADVPESLQELAKVIAKEHGTTFSTLTKNMAYNTLMNDKGTAGMLFKEFLRKHGHRCIKEFDPYSISWAMEPENLMPTLQNLVASPNILNVNPKKEISVEEAISNLKTPLSNSTKKILKVVLPWSRQAVREREKTKSMLIKFVDWLRQTCLHLGKFMMEEGMLPNKELIFFLTLEEIQELITTRRPGLVSKAMRRSRLHSKLDKLQFPEIIKGIPKPLSLEKDLTKYSASFTLKGIPVCQGKVKATARVVMSLSEASTIQLGDILITHSTDIGWSPYFPLLSGVVTVLGGLISHGAVVAREYGLPCVVGVQEATTAFKSGDIIILDGSKGTISKITNVDDN